MVLNTEHIVFHAPSASSLSLTSRPIRRSSHSAKPLKRHQEKPDAAEAFARYVLARAGLKDNAYRRQPLVRRVSACLRALRLKSIEEARELIARDTVALHTAVNTLLIGVTEFYRDPPAFEMLEDWLEHENRRMTRPWRVWSVGCSDGAELYTVAMLLHHMDALRDAELVGSDCRAEAIARAERGVYHRGLIRHLPESLLPYLRTKNATHVQPIDPIRRATRWQVADVLDDPPPVGSFDLILCRNMGIYLDGAAASGLWRKLCAALRPGGVLMTGHAEQPSGVAGLCRMASCLYCKES